MTLHDSRSTIHEPFETVSKSIEETQQLAEQLGRCLEPGDVLGLVGDLGGGKTTFIQGLAKGLGLDPSTVKSPTFVLMREYPGSMPLIHIDAYRLEDQDSVVWLDLEWLFSPRKVTVIEWADRVAGCLPDDHLEIRFAHKSANQRMITLVPRGKRSSEVVDQLTRRSPLAGQGSSPKPSTSDA